MYKKYKLGISSKGFIILQGSVNYFPKPIKSELGLTAAT